MNAAPGRNPALIGGALLVVVGLLLLVVQQTGATLAWPLWIVAAGSGLIVLGIATGVPGQGFAAIGGMVAMVGAILAVQEATDTYASWAYAWALVAPFGVGLGVFLYGLFTGRSAAMRSGIGPMIVGLVLFLVFALIFEGMVGLNGKPLGGAVAPALLVLLGGVILVAAFLPPRWRGAPPPPPSGQWTGSPPGAAGTGAAGSAAFAAGATGAAATATADGQPVAVDLQGASAGDVAIAFGAGHLAIGGVAPAGRLVDGVAHGGLRVEGGGPGRVKLSTPGEALWNATWTGAPFDWRLALTGEVPLRLNLELGASRSDLDLGALRLSELRLRTGAAETRVTLPASAGQTRVDVEGGATTVEFRVPDGVAARIRSQMVLGTSDIDEARFPRDPLGGWASPDYATAANRVEIEMRGGMGSVRVR